jgi:hypothetical protein
MPADMHQCFRRHLASLGDDVVQQRILRLPVQAVRAQAANPEILPPPPSATDILIDDSFLFDAATNALSAFSAYALCKRSASLVRKLSQRV